VLGLGSDLGIRSFLVSFTGCNILGPVNYMCPLVTV